VNQEPLPTNVTTWPGAFKAFKLSRDAVRVNLGTTLGLIAVSIAASLGWGILSGMLHIPKVIEQVVSYALSMWISTASVILYLASARHTTMSAEQVLKNGLPLTFKYFLLILLCVLISALSLLLLIVPFFFVAPRLAFAPYYLIDKKLGPIDAIKASWKESKGNVGKLWGIFGVKLLFLLLSLVLVGIYFSVMYSAVLAILYLHVTEQSNK